MNAPHANRRRRSTPTGNDHASPQPPDPRDIVVRRAREQLQRYPELRIESLDTRGLDARDAALAQAIDHILARHWITLTKLVRCRIDRPWENVQTDVRAVLLVGAAQLFYLDRVPDHAATNHAVAWAKRHIARRTGGFVNAVMRGLIRLRGDASTETTKPDDVGDTLDQNMMPLADGRVLLLREAVFSDQPVQRIAEQTSHPDALIAHWSDTFSPADARAIALHNVMHAPIIVTGVEPDELPEELRTLLSPHDVRGFHVFDGPHDALKALLKHTPDARVQDPTSAHPVTMLHTHGPFDRIADYCAGNGTKTAQLALAFPEATIVASDPDDTRRATLRKRFHGKPHVKVIEPDTWLHHAGSFDLVLLDAPCSNTGVLARRVEAKYRYSKAQVDSLLALQRQIVADAIPLCASAGAIAYATCSIDPAENQRLSEWIESWHPFTRAAEDQIMPRGLPGSDGRTYRDGGYVALFRRTASRS